MRLFQVRSPLHLLVLALSAGCVLAGCSHSLEVKQQAYAKLKSDRVYENDFPAVWKGIEETFRSFHARNRDPSDVDANEMKRLRKRSLETDWVYTLSRDKYVEYKINDSPRKQYLQTRLKYKIIAESVLGGVRVTVKPEEEIEKLKPDGSSDGYDAVDEIDSSRTSEILDKINMAMLSAAP